MTDEFDEVLNDAIQGLELLKPALGPIAAEFPAARLAVTFIPLLEEALLAIRTLRAGEKLTAETAAKLSPTEEQKDAMRAQVTGAAQDLAVLKLEAQPKGDDHVEEASGVQGSGNVDLPAGGSQPGAGSGDPGGVEPPSVASGQEVQPKAPPGQVDPS